MISDSGVLVFRRVAKILMRGSDCLHHTDEHTITVIYG